MTCRDVILKMLGSTGLYDLDEGSLIYAEVAAYGAGLALLEEDIATLYREIFVQTAEGYGLDIWGMVNGHSFEEMGVELRRELLLKRMAIGHNDYTLDGIRRSYEALGVSVELVDDEQWMDLKVKVLDYVLPFPGQQRILKICSEAEPAHLFIDYEF